MCWLMFIDVPESTITRVRKRQRNRGSRFQIFRLPKPFASYPAMLGKNVETSCVCGSVEIADGVDDAARCERVRLKDDMRDVLEELAQEVEALRLLLVWAEGDVEENVHSKAVPQRSLSEELPVRRAIVIEGPSCRRHP